MSCEIFLPKVQPRSEKGEGRGPIPGDVPLWTRGYHPFPENSDD